jgi:uncharacterized membrane protein (DUF2068 family)
MLGQPLPVPDRHELVVASVPDNFDARLPAVGRADALRLGLSHLPNLAARRRWSGYTCALMAHPDPPVAPPGALPARRRHKVDWELISCGLNGHVLIGLDAASVKPEDHALVRESGDTRWYRCLRCDAWVALAPPEQPSRPAVPTLDEIDIPLRGPALRDRYVLRFIAVERCFHVLIFGLLAVAIFLFIPHRQALQSDYAQLLRDLRNGTVGGNVGRGGIWTMINRLFTIHEADLIVVGVALVAYCVVLSAEIVGLWRARRWAEYLTFVESSVLLPYEIYELTASVTVLKVAGLIFNLAILLYLAIVHRLFGVRGGAGAVRARYEAGGGRLAVERATPDPAIGAPGDLRVNTPRN